MPLVARDGDGRLLDATCDDLGCEVPWEQVHRVRPRAQLTCPGCGGRMHAKVSPAPHWLRFFAHDAAPEDCPLGGETLAHRLLKAALAAAVREAGWLAQLEVPGEGWRADVLATSPDGSLRMAWEAQLSPITVEEITRRTDTMHGSGVRVCWVAERDTPWLDHVPSIRIRSAAAGEFGADGGSALLVSGGVRALRIEYCDRDDCEGSYVHVLSPLGTPVRPHPCPGHGSWPVPPALTLARFVRLVCHRQVRPHQLRCRRWDEHTRGRRDVHGNLVWTAPAYITREETLLATQQRLRGERETNERRHAAAVEALLARQQQLVKPTVEFIFRETGTYPRIADGPREPRWAMGVPVFVSGRPHAVICPVASRLPELRGVVKRLLIFVASASERDRIARSCHPGQRIQILTPAADSAPPPAQPGPDAGASIGRLAARAVGLSRFSGM